MISPKNRRLLLQIIPFGIVPGVFSLIYSLLERGILGNNHFYPSTGNPYTPQLIVPAILSMIFGWLLGAFEVMYLNKWFQKKSFTTKIIFKATIHLVTLVIASLTIITFINAVGLGLNPFDRQLWSYTVTFLSDLAFWSIVAYFTMAIVICLFYMEVSDNIGQAVLLNFFTGKYHHPIEEERLYMFLDMKSSTTIAEQLGHKRYFQLLKEYYVDLSDSIIQYGGEIYMYVGDEVIITWKLKKGFANNSLNCFFAMKKALSAQAQKFQSEYGIVPSFKAGIHYGKVTTGEIGVIKREITFSGDVLNTTARIQGLCNTYEVDLLVSEKIVNALEPNQIFKPTALGEAELRGRNEKISLFTIERQAQ